MDRLTQQLAHALKSITGYIYPNEIELHWGILIVIYPYLTGLVAGAFILASLVKVFKVKALEPTYRLSLLTALSFLIIAPIPLLAHLGHPERFYEILFTPNTQSAMAMFGFVYAWYLMMVLLLEIWFDYRSEMVKWASESTGIKKLAYRAFALWSTDNSEKAIAFDKRAVRYITLIGIPSAFPHHGYVVLILGSIKANPCWSSVLIPVVFLFSAIVSGIALMLLIYLVTSLWRGIKIDMPCIDKMSEFLLYALIIDFSLELLDFVHRLYQSEESIEILGSMIEGRLFISLVIVQMLLGTILPLIALGITRMRRRVLPEELRRMIYLLAAIFIQAGIFSTRWNVVIGGQLFSKSLRGLTIYKMEVLGIEGLLMAILLLVLPFVVLGIMVKILPPWEDEVQTPTV